MGAVISRAPARLRSPTGAAVPDTILWWQESFSSRRGGVQIVAERLLRGLRDRGHRIAIVAGGDAPGVAVWEDLPVLRFPFWQALRTGDLEAIARLRGEIARLDHDLAPDLLHVNGLGPSAFFHPAGRPRLLALHSSNILGEAADTLVRHALERAAWVTACSQALLETACAAAPSIAGRASVVHNAADLPDRAPGPFPAVPRVLCLGTLGPHKGLDLAIRALPALRDRFPAVRLILAGDGPSRDELAALATRLGVAGSVELAGAVAHDDVPHLIRTASVVAMPSRRESFGLVAVEAALMGRPVVATRVGGLPEVVSHGETGLLVAPDRVSELTAALAALLASPALAARLGDEGRRRAVRRFAPEQQLDAYAALYHRVVQAAPRPSCEP